MTIEIGLILAAIVALLVLSAFFNASETSLTACSKARMHSLAEEGNLRAKLVNKLMATPERLLGAVLLVPADDPWTAFEAALGTFSDDFMTERVQPALEQRESL